MGYIQDTGGGGRGREKLTVIGNGQDRHQGISSIVLYIILDIGESSTTTHMSLCFSSLDSGRVKEHMGVGVYAEDCLWEAEGTKCDDADIGKF